MAASPPDVSRFSEQVHLFNWSRLSQERFRQQVEFVTPRIQEALTAVLARSSQPPVLVIQSDHGNGPHWGGSTPSKLGLHERTAILSAYRVDEVYRKKIYPDISPVNTFLMICNSYFGSGFPLLPDRVYFSPAVEPQQFLEVTQDLSKSEWPNQLD